MAIWAICEALPGHFGEPAANQAGFDVQVFYFEETNTNPGIVAGGVSQVIHVGPFPSSDLLDVEQIRSDTITTVVASINNTIGPTGNLAADHVVLRPYIRGFFVPPPPPASFPSNGVVLWPNNLAIPVGWISFNPGPLLTAAFNLGHLIAIQKT